MRALKSCARPDPAASLPHSENQTVRPRPRAPLRVPFSPGDKTQTPHQVSPCTGRCHPPPLSAGARRSVRPLRTIAIRQHHRLTTHHKPFYGGTVSAMPLSSTTSKRPSVHFVPVISSTLSPRRSFVVSTPARQGGTSRYLFFSGNV